MFFLTGAANPGGRTETMNDASRTIPTTVDMRRRDRVRARRQLARCTDVDLIAERLVGVRDHAPLAYTIALPRWW